MLTLYIKNIAKEILAIYFFCLGWGFTVNSQINHPQIN